MGGGLDQVGTLVLPVFLPPGGEGGNLPTKSGCLHLPRAFSPALDHGKSMGPEAISKFLKPGSQYFHI